MEKLILASGSPRRRELLTIAGWPFEVIVAGVDESLKPNEDAENYVTRLAKAKAEAVASQLHEGLVLGADTTVVIDDEILGKPKDQDDAARMLRLLNGKWHAVLTGVALVRVGSEALVDCERTRVKFAEMSDKEIQWYLSTGEPEDKAGAYAIQGKGSRFIEEIEGDYFNIVGLPIRLLYEMVQRGDH